MDPVYWFVGCLAVFVLSWLDVKNRGPSATWSFLGMCSSVVVALVYGIAHYLVPLATPIYMVWHPLVSEGVYYCFLSACVSAGLLIPPSLIATWNRSATVAPLCSFQSHCNIVHQNNGVNAAN